MALLQNMSMAGSIAVVIYICLGFFTKRNMPILWHKIYLSVAAIVFIFPFICIKYEHSLLMEKLFNIKQRDENIPMVWDLTHRSILVFNDGIYVHDMWKHILVFAGLMVSVFITIFLIKKYKKVYFAIINEADIKKHDIEVLSGLSQKLKINKKPNIHVCNEVESPVSIGFFSKKIVIPDKKWDSDELECVLHHELIHIKVMDNWFKLILLIITAINFYNPFVYYLLYRWNLVSEMYCDEKVIAQKNNDEIKRYANLIVDFAEDKNNVVLPMAGLSINKRQMKERILNMKKTEKKYGVLSYISGAVIIFLSVFAASLSVYAYEPPIINRFDENIDKDAEYEVMFIEDGAENPYADPVIEEFEKYITSEDMELFIDDKGNVYFDIHLGNAGQQTYAVCRHSYEYGKYSRHKKNGSKGCIMEIFYGNVCTKCGYTIAKESISTLTYTICPH